MVDGTSRFSSASSSSRGRRREEGVGRRCPRRRKDFGKLVKDFRRDIENSLLRSSVSVVCGWGRGYFSSSASIPQSRAGAERRQTEEKNLGKNGGTSICSDGQ